MGSPEGEGSSDEHPQHTLYLPDYYIARTPTTNAQYLFFTQATGYKPPRHWEGGRPPRGQENHPVVYVSWHDALAFARWAGGALPSEAEWEKAAGWDPRAGRKRRYPWGGKWDANRCRALGQGTGRPMLVKQYSPQGDSAYGCADMAGNVWEWCRSLFEPYPYVPDDGREDLAAEGRRVLRGGSWGFNRHGARCAYRHGFHPNHVWYDFGFRVCVSPISPISGL